MWKGVVAAIAGAFLLAAGATRADEMVPDKWLFNCKVDAMTDMRFCRVAYGATVPGSRPANWVMISIARTPTPDGALYLGASPAKYACPGKPVMLRVDKNKAVTLPQADNGSHVLLGVGSADAIVEQFRAGDRLAVRVWLFPGCTATDLTIPLKGFTTAWKRYEAEGG
jgi:invasion protein IalB